MLKVILNVTIYYFFIVSNVFALNPHVDELAYYTEIEQVRKISSISTPPYKCESNRSFGCVQYVDSLSREVLRFSLEGSKVFTFDVKVKFNCIESNNILKNAQSLELKNIQINKYFSASADVYVDGYSLRSICDRRRMPSSF